MYVIKRGDWGFKIKHINDVVDFLRINLTISDPWDKLFFELTNDHWVGGDFGDGGKGFFMHFPPLPRIKKNLSKWGWYHDQAEV